MEWTPSGELIEYVQCSRCLFTFAPACYQWSPEQFAQKVYNEDYVKYDPDYVEARPRFVAGKIMNSFDPEFGRTLRHLDYGGGNGLMSACLREQGWNSRSYDPFVNRDVEMDTLGEFDLITVTEVFEHVPDPLQLVVDLATLIKDDGVVIFTTLLADNDVKVGQPLNWWYAAPRNGHISLYSALSLVVLGARVGLKYHWMPAGWHLYYRNVPEWGPEVLGLEAAGSE
ncbi:class I SAM-dependent methyltransferase [Chitinimonas sp. DQS-5]|uniref:Class I SAM-dependent methyltransferase n=2 Tax=Parachitinimonas caeni TaxID=3031301 RepID=A0ABT7DTY6_9NEIS|nr:class I SAM-dependent methyltransferase [Parachitinimonas caeni]